MGATCYGDLYYECGSLDAYEITKQHIDMLTSYGLLDIRFVGIVGSGGCGNEQLFTNIAQKKKMAHGKWPAEEYTSLYNSISTNTRTFVGLVVHVHSNYYRIMCIAVNLSLPEI